MHTAAEPVLRAATSRSAWRSSTSKVVRFWTFAVLLGCALCFAIEITRAQLAIEGIQDRQVIADQALFRVLSSAEFETTAFLDGRVAPTDEWIEVRSVDYHELIVTRVLKTGGVEENHRVQFIVRASERGNSEWGLPPWTPLPLINSSPQEMDSAQLKLITPSVWPADREMPVAAVLVDAAGAGRRVNAGVPTPDGGSIQLRRGAGSGWLAATRDLPTLEWSVEKDGLEAHRSIVIEPTTEWQQVGGTVPGDTEWSHRVAVTNDLTVPAGAVLTVPAGAIVSLFPDADIVVEGRVMIGGTADAPVAFTAEDRAKPWGGFILRGAPAELVATDTLFVRSGANPDWFSENPGYGVHREEQALFLVDGARLALTNCFAFDLAGQFGHGKLASVMLDHCLVQRCVTGGEYNGGTVQIRDSWLLECPVDDDTFADGDNDGIYFTTGAHEIRNSVIGWMKDDGIDHGSGGAGTLTLDNVWVESCYHEAFAWSGAGRVVRMTNCVALNCGQGIEAGWSDGTNSPDVFAENCLSTANLTGARLGDNYNWAYNGFLRVTNSFLLFNYRDIWGLNWADWTWRTNQMDLRGNWVSVAAPEHPENTVWNPATDGIRLAAFLPVAAGVPVGVGFARREARADPADLTNGVPVRLASFTAHPVRVAVVAQNAQGRQHRADFEFPAGQMVKWFQLPPADVGTPGTWLLSLNEPQGAIVTGPPDMWVLPADPDEPIPPPARLNWSEFGDGLLLWWDVPGARLEAAAGPDGPWQPLMNPANPFLLFPAESTFYRLRRPSL